MQHSTAERLRLRVEGFHAEAKGIVVLDLRADDGRELPPSTPGAHLEVQLGNGLVRHYSLLNAPGERHRYRVAVGLVADGRGGSRFIHGKLREGDLLLARPPANNFALGGDAGRYCFVAGGIGITPILSMLHWCVEQRRDWRLVYSVRSRQHAAFLGELRELCGARLQLHCTDEHAGRRLDVEALVGSLAADEHLYCCGPEPLMQAVRQAGEGCGERLHFEWFGPPAEEPPARSGDGFELRLRRSARRLWVGAEQSILEALEENGLEVPFACRAGICRTCETGVCAGEPDHRDHVLSAEERASGRQMLICVSRCHGTHLELDL